MDTGCHALENPSPAGTLFIAGRGTLWTIVERLTSTAAPAASMAYPPRSADEQAIEVTQAWLDELASDEQRVDVLRERLSNLGWFMKALKEPLARMANKEDDCTGTFRESRFKSIAILDDEALLATCAYTDLNPVAPGLAATPETGPHSCTAQQS